MNILDYLKPDKFPNKYILKQYTKTAKSQPTFDTRDYNTTASDGAQDYRSKTSCYSSI